MSEKNKITLSVKQKNQDDDDNYSVSSYDSRANRPKPAIDFGGDNWDLIAKFNQKQFEKEKIDNKIKDKEIKSKVTSDNKKIEEEFFTNKIEKRYFTIDNINILIRAQEEKAEKVNVNVKVVNKDNNMLKELIKNSREKV